jgi:hypothetical protein
MSMEGFLLVLVAAVNVCPHSRMGHHDTDHQR